MEALGLALLFFAAISTFSGLTEDKKKPQDFPYIIIQTDDINGPVFVPKNPEKNK